MGTYMSITKIRTKRGDVLDIYPEFPQDYALYGFLGCNYRNYSKVLEIEGIEEHYDEEESSICLATLLNFDYTQTFENRRYTKKISATFADGGATCEIGDGEMVRYVDYFSSDYFQILEELKNYCQTHSINPEHVDIFYYFD